MPTLPWKNARKNYKINSWMEEKRMLELPETLTVALLLQGKRLESVGGGGENADETA